jgi:tRNA (adenine57-N1/adenine58-N1)-methyltransferase
MRVIKLERKIKDEGKIVKIMRKENYYFSGKDINLKIGKLSKDKIKPGFLKQDKEEYAILKNTNIDIIKRFKKNAQSISEKDAGIIISNIGLDKNQTVIEAGTGSGALTAHLALIAKEVHTLDINEDHQATAKKNLKRLDLDNIKFFQEDICNFEAKKYYDAMILDVKEPHKALKSAINLVKKSGHLVTYSPNISQVQETVKKLPKQILYEKTVEIIEREWKVDDKSLRPKTKDHQHTAFLSFFRII